MCDSRVRAGVVPAANDDARIMNGYEDDDGYGGLRQRGLDSTAGRREQEQNEFRQQAKMAAAVVVARTTTFADFWPAASTTNAGINYSASHSARDNSTTRIRSDIINTNNLGEEEEDKHRSYLRIEAADEDYYEGDADGNTNEVGEERVNVLSSCDLISANCNQSSHNQEHHKKTAFSSVTLNQRHQHLMFLVLALLTVLLASAQPSSAFLLDGSQSSFAQFRKWYSGLNGTLELEFKSDQPNGLVLYTDDGGTYDFFELKLVEGVLRLRYNLGGGAQIITVGRDLHDGHWHKVQVNKSTPLFEGRRSGGRLLLPTNYKLLHCVAVR